jgi:hypothetical protein
LEYQLSTRNNSRLIRRSKRKKLKSSAIKEEILKTSLSMTLAEFGGVLAIKQMKAKIGLTLEAMTSSEKNRL